MVKKQLTKKELSLIYDALIVYYEMELESDALDTKDKAELMYNISKTQLKVLKLYKSTNQNTNIS